MPSLARACCPVTTVGIALFAAEGSTQSIKDLSHRQANFFALGQRAFYWEWGVIPYEMAIDLGNVAGNARFAFDKYTFPTARTRLIGPTSLRLNCCV